MLPNAERAVIDPATLRDYLLSPTHSVGRFKAAFFTSLGYEAVGWQRLEADLRAQQLSQRAQELEATPFGRKFLVRGRLEGHPARQQKSRASGPSSPPKTSPGS